MNDDNAPLKLELEEEDRLRYLEIVNTYNAILKEYRELYELYVKALREILLRRKNKYYDDDVVDTRGAIIDSVFSNIPPEVFCRVTGLDYIYVYAQYKKYCKEYGLDIPVLNNKDLSTTVLNRIKATNLDSCVLTE